MIVGSAPETAVATIFARGFRPSSLPTLVADHRQRGTVDDARGVARVVDVVDLLDPVVLLQRHVVEAGVSADLREGRLEPGEPLGRGVGADGLVTGRARSHR
jgi:hypothetical protein